MLTVRDAMTPHVITVRPETPLKEVAQILIDANVSGLPVVDDAGKVLGVVSEADFLIKGQGPLAIRHRRLARLLGESGSSRQQLNKLAARTAAEAMTTPPVTIAPSQSLAEAAACMVQRRVNRLPVVEKGWLVGIVTRADLVRAYLRSDEELASTIRDDVLLRSMWLDPAAFEVEVRNGEARVRGHVDRRSTARIIEESVATIPGIVAVFADITWAMDDRDIRPAVADPVFPYGER
ncbi:MAG TPA: CBS domain-containing protein [Candidatus Limnocylindrales bacterium]|jgi:CBS domain-containing protein|nr:CBS domain-containing protein [Candidatus Limnocylindrales bacterium]